MSPLNSFWMGGFESSTHINRSGERLDLIAATQHDTQAEADYRLLRTVGLHGARDAVRWHLLERGGRIDLAPLAPRVLAAERAGMQVIWDLCHYGWPAEIDVFSPEFVKRFARFAGAVAHFMAQHASPPRVYIPVNEISYLAWAAGEEGHFYPFARRRGAELKRQLVRAFIAAAEAIWRVDPGAHVLTAEPLIHIVPGPALPGEEHAAPIQRESQFEAWEMLLGRQNPELGGAEKYVSLMGVNYYSLNQWEEPGGRHLRWDGRPLDERWRPLRFLLEEAWQRYRRPLFIAETSHYGAGRAAWLRQMVGEVTSALRMGVPVRGVCLYPIIDRHDWEETDEWHNSGLWDLRLNSRGGLERVLVKEYAAELSRAQEALRQAALVCRPGGPAVALR